MCILEDSKTMENEQQIIDYCNAFNQRAGQYQESVQKVLAEGSAEKICEDLGIVIFSGSD